MIYFIVNQLTIKIIKIQPSVIYDGGYLAIKFCLIQTRKDFEGLTMVEICFGIL